MSRVFRDPSLQESFDRNGYVVADLLTGRECDYLVNLWRSTPCDLEPMSFSNTIMSRDLSYRSKIHEEVSAVFRPAVDALLDGYRICLCSYNVKRPKDERGRVEMHQDWTFVDESRFKSIGMWCPLTEVTLQNGCLRVVPGSHRLNTYPRGFLDRFPYEDLLDCIEKNYVKAVPMKPGQAFVYTQTLFHSSLPNYSNEVRVAAGTLAIPHEARLRFLMNDEVENPKQIRVYEVADDFYVSYFYGTMPDNSLQKAVINAQHEPLSEQRLHSVLRGGNATGRH